MPVYDSRATSLLEKFCSASDAEGVAIKALLAYMQGGGNDDNKLSALTERMIMAHDSAVRIYQEMQQFRLDKP